VLFIRDEESGIYWTPTALPIREETAYRARHGAGYTVFEHNSNGIEQELTVFVPMDDNGGQPIKLQRLRLKNDSSRSRRLSVTYFVEWTLGEHRETSQRHIVTHWDDELQCVLARNGYHPDYPGNLAFATLTPPPTSFSDDRLAFIGRNRNLANPVAMEQAELPRQTGLGFDPCAALQVSVELEPGETTMVTSLLGEARSMAEVVELVQMFREDSAVERALVETRAWWDRLLGCVEVHTPELSVNFLINRWLLYQTLSSRFWGRTAFYQSSGAFGFRDQLQDVMALVYGAPALARQHLLHAASRQFKEGDVQHWWHQPGGAGVRSRISDDSLWLPYVVAHYIRTTGDRSILDEFVPFIEGPALQENEFESFFTPQTAAEGGTLFEHCCRAVNRCLSFGPHGLPLIGTGDWNDGLNRVGHKGKGESVWLGWFLVQVLQDMAELSDFVSRPDLRSQFESCRKTLIERLEKFAWDGEWYLRAIFDDGTPIGSARNAEAKIDSLPQSWACLTGAADQRRVSTALQSAWNHLVREEEGLVLLFAPPFDKAEPSPGYIRAYPPGVRENGGQYTHAAIWLAIAFARQGEGERAVKLLRMLNPIERARDAESVWRYGIEPYVIAADIYSTPGHVGQGGWSWYTGSAGWMFRAWVEEIFGLKVRGDFMQLDPVIPPSWGGFRLRCRFGEAVYEIQVENPEGREHGVAWVEMDGRHLPDGVIPLEKHLVKHHILVRMGNPPTP
jgi:cyclic beta-1,2-glucan synthetase